MVKQSLVRTSVAQNGEASGFSALGSHVNRASKTYEQIRNRPILVLGQLLFFILTFALALPLTIRNTQQFTATYILLCAGFTLLAILVSRAFVRPVFPIIILMAIQIWMIICYFLVSPYVVPLPIFGRHLYWPTLVVLPYFVLGSICILDPTWRHKALRILFYFCLVNALVGIGQFFRLPGFSAIQQFYAPTAMAVDFEGNAPNAFRAVGLTLHPYHLAAQCVFGMAVIGSNLLYRRLTKLELWAMAAFMLALFVAQSRAYYLSGGVTVLVLLGLLFYRDKRLFLYSSAVLVVGSFALLTYFNARLDYGLRGQNTIAFGRIDRWQAAARIVQEFPLTGVGPSSDIFGNDRLNLPSRRNLQYTENGYRMLAATGGIPGVALLLAGIIGASIICIRVVIKERRDELQRRMALVGVLYIFSVAVALGITNFFEHELLTFLGVATAAISLPDVGKAFANRRRRLLGEGFKNVKQAV